MSMGYRARSCPATQLSRRNLEHRRNIPTGSRFVNCLLQPRQLKRYGSELIFSWTFAPAR
jgi:hypothetical protein